MNTEPAIRETMTSRQRVIATLNHQPTDRYPIDLGSHPSTGISAFAYWSLREYLGLKTDSVHVYDTVQFLATVDQDILERFHIDCICLEPAWCQSQIWNPRGRYQFVVPVEMTTEKQADGVWVVTRDQQKMRIPDGGFFFDGDWICAWENLDEDQALALYAREAERLYKETPYAMNYVGYSRGCEGPSFFRDINQAMQMLIDPEDALADNEARCEQAIRRAEKIIKQLGPYVQLISIGNDMGMQNAPIIRPEHFEKFCAPFYKRYCDFIHTNSDMKIFLHSCGSIQLLMPILLECGIDVFNPVQISAMNMDPKDLKSKFGDRAVFWGGGCDTQNVLGSACPKDVAENVRQLASAFKPGGGFVFNQVHNVMGNVPPENTVAMFDTAYEMSFYH